MNTIHLTIDNQETDEIEEFNVSRDILSKSEYFKGLLEIQNDNIQLHNINPKHFKMMLWMIESETDVMKDIVKLFDYCGFDNDCPSLNKYVCVIGGCSKIADEKYCILHKCYAATCQNKKRDSSICCSSHKCSIVNCVNHMYDNCKLCTDHKCQYQQCVERPHVLFRFCMEHVCKYDAICNKQIMSQDTQFCEDHKCNGYNCNNRIWSGGFCSNCR